MPSASRPKSRPPARAKALRTKPAGAPTAAVAAPAASPPAIMRIAHELASWANSALGVAEGATEMTIAAAKSLARSPRRKGGDRQGGRVLARSARSGGDHGRRARNCGRPARPGTDRGSGERQGRVAVRPRLATRGGLGRNDPISFALKLTRSYSPGNWRALDDLGVGKLVVQAGRERDFANTVGERCGAGPLRTKTSHTS